MCYLYTFTDIYIYCSIAYIIGITTGAGIIYLLSNKNCATIEKSGPNKDKDDTYKGC